MKKKNAAILVIDDDAGIRRSLHKILDYEGYEVLLAENGSQGVNFALQNEPDLILLDIKMPKMDGLEVLETLQKQGTSCPVIMISGHGTIQTAVEATRLGAFDFLEKPLDRDRLLLACRNALEMRSLAQENTRLKGEIANQFEMVGEHPSFQALIKRIDLVAPTNATVLITGESGTGKELVARRLHECSARSGSFIQVNCAAIPDDLIESELFGHVKGAFTGAVETQKGKFHLADGGTIFLDEIGDMSLHTQAKVLRVLQEGEVEPVGAGKVHHVDVRVVAATNRNLEDAIADGTFREDLFYRLNVVPVRSPSLDERRSDIPLLIDFFQSRFAEENHLPERPVSKQAVAYLQSRSYPGNIRELKNLVERILILGEEEVLGVEQRPRQKNSLDDIPFDAFGTLKEFKEAMERRFIIAKLKQHHGNISKTAEVIDTPRSNLYKKLDQYDIKVDRI